MNRSILLLCATMAMYLAGCNPDGGSHGFAPGVPQAPKPPTVKPVTAPKPIQPLKVKAVKAPASAQPFEPKPTAAPKPLEPHRSQPTVRGPYKPDGKNRTAISPTPEKAAARYLLEQDR